MDAITHPPVPANEPIHGALPKGLEHLISKAVQDGLNPGGINCIRNINGKITVWGARTIGGDMNADLKYVSTRRLLRSFSGPGLAVGVRDWLRTTTVPPVTP